MEESENESDQDLKLLQKNKSKKGGKAKKTKVIKKKL